MADLPTPAEITGLASLLAPGLIILGIRTRFKDGARPDIKEGAVGYGIASVAYFSAITPLFHIPNGEALSPWLWGFLQFFLCPCAIGMAIVVIDQREWLYKICYKLKLTLPHHTPAAWDYAFAKTKGPRYVIAKLHDGTKYAGVYGSSSFASSSKDERDLLLEDVWKLNEEGAWTHIEPQRSVLLCGSDISWIEIIGRSTK